MKICPKCESKHGKNGIFCSRKCSNSRSWNEEDKKKKSESAKNSDKVKLANTLRRKVKNFNKRKFKRELKRLEDKRKNELIKKRFCKNCKREINKNNKSGFCTNCCHSASEYRNLISIKNKGKTGGYKENSGYGKHGWYEGYRCQSSYELAFVIYYLDHGINFERNNKGFEYHYNGKNLKFYPDFIVNDIYYEIKGFKIKKDEYKWNNFPYQLKILYKEDLKDIFTYIKMIYGKNFINLYQNNPYNELTNNCKVCNKPIKKKNIY